MQAFAESGNGRKERITGTESVMDAVMKLAEGNPGALRVLVDLLRGTWHDVPGFLMLLNLDSMGVYGSNIWVLFKDCCGESMDKLEQAIRAWKLGKLPIETIREHINCCKTIDNLKTVEELLAAL